MYAPFASASTVAAEPSHFHATCSALRWMYRRALLLLDSRPIVAARIVPVSVSASGLIAVNVAVPVENAASFPCCTTIWLLPPP